MFAKVHQHQKGKNHTEKHWGSVYETLGKHIQLKLVGNDDQKERKKGCDVGCLQAACSCLGTEDW